MFTIIAKRRTICKNVNVAVHNVTTVVHGAYIKTGVGFFHIRNTVRARDVLRRRLATIAVAWISVGIDLKKVNGS